MPPMPPHRLNHTRSDMACSPRHGCQYVPRDRTFTLFVCDNHNTTHSCSEQCPWRVPTRHGFVCPVSGRYCGAVVCDDTFHGVARVLEAATAAAPKRRAVESQESVQNRLTGQITGILRRLFAGSRCHGDGSDSEDFSAQVHGLASELARLRRVYGSRMHHCTMEAHVLSFVDAFRTGYVFGNEVVVERNEWVAAYAPSMSDIEKLGFKSSETATGKRALATAMASFCTTPSEEEEENEGDFHLDVNMTLPVHAQGRCAVVVAAAAAAAATSPSQQQPLQPQPLNDEDVHVFLTEFD